jgi:Ser/Thr protein kinase RdoA (MazF antagonist)
MEFHKPQVSAKDLSTIVSYYPFGDLKKYIDLGGIPNSTFKVEVSAKTFVVRIYGQGQSSLDHIIFEHEVLRHLERLDFPSPRLIKARDNSILKQWQGYWVCATEFIEGVTADKIERTPALLRDVGKLVASFEKAMRSADIHVPEGETFMERGDFALQSLPSGINKLGLDVDLSNVIAQWERSCRSFILNRSYLKSNILHADIWPPNVICREEEVVGLTDFDDCCYGATIIDLALALMEFTMFEDITMDFELAHELFCGYLQEGGNLTALEASMIVDAMEMACAMWYAYNVIEAPIYQEAEIYLSRLNQFYSTTYKKYLLAKILGIIKTAQNSIATQF